MDLNKVMIIGRLTRDPEMRTTATGINVTKLGIATSYVYTNQQTGQKVEQTEFHNVVLWRKLGEIANQYLKKGTQVFIEGRLQTSNWDDKQNVKHYRTEIIADNMIMLGRPGGSSASGQASMGGGTGYSKPATATSPEQPFVEETLPTIDQNSDRGENINVEDIPF